MRMKNPTRPDVPEIPNEPANSSAKVSIESRFSHLLATDRIENPNQFFLDVYERSRDVRDIFTYLVYEDDYIIFRVVDDVCRNGDNFGSKPFYDITLYIVDPAHREEMFSTFLDSVPDNETERRAALVAALKNTTGGEWLLKSKGIAYKTAYKAIFV